MPMNYETALNRAAGLCSTSEHCTKEIQDKLQKWGLSPIEIERAINYLIDEKYIDNSRFCRAYAKDKLRYNHWGRIKIRTMLHQLVLSSSEIEEGLAAIDEEEYLQVLREVAKQKEHSIHDEDEYARMGKLARHLLSHGFESDLVMELCRQSSE